MWTLCSLWDLLQMTKSSTHSKTASQSLMAQSTSRWKDATAFLKPKGILMYSKRPKGMVVAVF